MSMCNSMLARPPLLWLAAAGLMGAASTSGTWVGDSWIPPNGEILTVSQIQRIHGDRNTLVVGDSLARRFTSTLALVLQDRSFKDLPDAVVDSKAVLGKGSHTRASYAIPKLGGNGTRLLDFQWNPFARDVTKMVRQLHKQPLPKYSLLIVCIGIHDAEETKKSIESVLAATQDTLAALAAPWNVSTAWNASHHYPTVVWRTTPYHDSRDGGAQSAINKRAEQMNVYVLHNHPGGVHVSNAAKHINPKSQGAERERGDTLNHYNNIIRWVEIQCVTHKLKHLQPDTY